MGHLPENVLQDIQGQRGGAEHYKQALLRLAVRRRKLLQRGQTDVCLNPGHWGDSREALEDTNKHTGSAIQLKYCIILMNNSSQVKCVKPFAITNFYLINL